MTTDSRTHDAEGALRMLSSGYSSPHPPLIVWRPAVRGAFGSALILTRAVVTHETPSDVVKAMPPPVNPAP